MNSTDVAKTALPHLEALIFSTAAKAIHTSFRQILLATLILRVGLGF